MFRFAPQSQFNGVPNGRYQLGPFAWITRWTIPALYLRRRAPLPGGALYIAIQQSLSDDDVIAAMAALEKVGHSVDVSLDVTLTTNGNDEHAAAKPSRDSRASGNLQFTEPAHRQKRVHDRVMPAPPALHDRFFGLINRRLRCSALCSSILLAGVLLLVAALESSLQPSGGRFLVSARVAPHRG